MRLRLHSVVNGVCVAAVAGLMLYICAFKLIDGDFWWHVKAGELMWKAGELLKTEPFSYVLADKPYGALHEWLAQIIFYGVFSAGGVTAAILMRAVLAGTAAIVLLCINRRAILLLSPLVVAAFYVHRATLMVRPQLFTLVCLALILLLTTWFAASGTTTTLLRRRLFFAAVLVIQILWVNLHGASAIFGVLCVGGLFLQSLYEWYVAPAAGRMHRMKLLRFCGLLFAVVIAALLASPNGVETFIDMYMHRFDRSIPLVREWMPLKWWEYATDVLPFGMLALVTLLFRRRSWVLCAGILAATFVLSLQSYRHCLIFVMVCIAVMSYQLASWGHWNTLCDKIRRYPLVAFPAAMAILLLLWGAMYTNDITKVFRANTYGFGVEIPVRGAVEFVKREGITGTLFNTYNQGSYILYGCTPQCRVFADGRNIEYGYPFVQKLLDAGTNNARWKELDAQYDFTYAIVEYKAVPEYGNLLPYINHIEADPTWILVYLDDTSSVYVRNLPQYEAMAQKHVYRMLSPAALEFTDTLARLTAAEWEQTEAELQRVIDGNPDGIKARIVLGDRYFATGRLKEAEAVALQAQRVQPYRPETYELLGRISVERQDWRQAGEYLERAVQLTGNDASQINFGYLAMVFSKAGQHDKAEEYHWKALRAGQESTVIEE